jgi:hypothetical protein
MRPNVPAHGVRRKLRRRLIATLMILGLAVGMTLTAGSGIANAGTGLRYQVIDADNAHDGGVFYRNSPSWNDTARINGVGGYYGETVELVCGAWGDAVGPYANRRWHLVDNLSRPAAGRGWLPDRYLNTPNNANQATPGEPECGAAPAPTPSISLAQGPPAPAGFRYAITLSSFPASSIISVSCRDSVTPGGFYNFSMVTDGAGNASTQNQCYSADGPDHWVVANGVESNHVGWGAGSGGGGTTPPPSGGGGSIPPPGGGGGSTTPPPGVNPCYFNMRWAKLKLTYSYLGNHRYLGNAVQAARNWTTSTGLTITQAPAGQRGDIEFVDVYKSDVPWAGSTLVPDSWQADPTFPGTALGSVPTAPHNPARIRIQVNQYWLDKKGADDYVRTYTLTHELGHALGLAHPEDCSLNAASIMRRGDGSILKTRPLYNTPQDYDVKELKMLYGLR